MNSLVGVDLTIKDIPDVEGAESESEDDIVNGSNPSSVRKQAFFNKRKPFTLEHDFF